MNASSDSFMNLRCGVVIYPAQAKAIDELLAELVERAQAQFAMLVDQSGLLVAMYGDRGKADLTSLSSLVAADIAASQEIARRLGQYQSYQLVLREGPQANIFIGDAGQHLALFVQVGRAVPLGWARMQIMTTARKMAEVMEKAPPPGSQADVELAQQLAAELSGLGSVDLDDVLSGGVAAGGPAPESTAGDPLSDLFGSALDAIWNDEDEDAH